MFISIAIVLFVFVILTTFLALLFALIASLHPDASIHLIEKTDTDVVLYRGAFKWIKYHLKFDQETGSWYSRYGNKLYNYQIYEASTRKKENDKHIELISKLWGNK